ncbi:hypothetical protein H8S90_14395 [Olivibacter sp. SDN3]|uniref:hypothetical protein n=1 Tax=Olivibacter sp. SDN3 TaxID=2764720 RepID=UPI00165173D1|nr:hypothetical protein [Olivibacter sp. SDN3]QNL47999.1 hypothetical protein H8S90_14395 [Olivibacter sp. SDN3]
MNDFIAEQIREALKDDDRVNVRIVSGDEAVDAAHANRDQFKQSAVEHRLISSAPKKRKTLLQCLWPF